MTSGLPLRAALVFLVMSVSAAGCGGINPGTGSPLGNGDKLTGRTFLSTAVTSHQLVEGTQISLSFPEAGKISARAGCNHLFGEVSFDGDKMVVTSMGGTDMGCDKPRMDQDTWLSQFLGSKPVWALNEDELVLTGGGVEIKLLDREVADPDRSLLGPRWAVDTLLDGEMASSVPGAGEAFLVFEAGDKVTGNTGCNTLMGTAKVGSEKIIFSAIGTTKRACPGSNALELAVLAVLDGEVTHKIEANRLTLTNPNGKGLILTTS